MTNFASNFITRWQDGGFFDLEAASKEGRIVIVNHDQTNSAYYVDESEQDSFAGWVAARWESDHAAREDSESASDYLDRIDVSISEL